MIDFTVFIQRLNQTKPLSIKLKDALFEGIRSNRFEANETFISPGNYPSAIYFIDSGIIRGAIEGVNERMTTWFKQEGDILLPQGLFNQQPSEEYVSTIIKTRVFSLSFNHLQKVISVYPEAMELLLLLTLEKNQEGAYRERLLRLPAARDRYDFVAGHEDYLLKRVPHYLIASYLNVTKETFSRLHKGLPY